MSANVSNLLYLVAGVLFILALRGLSHPTTSRQGNLFGMAGMALAILTTLAFTRPDDFSGLGARRPRPRRRRRRRRGDRQARADDGDAAARRGIPFRRRPCRRFRRGGGALCAAGLRHRRPSGRSRAARSSRWRLGVAIGAITFTGSVIAFLKLDGRMSGKPIMLPQRHVLNLALGALLVGSARRLHRHREPRSPSGSSCWSPSCSASR